MACSVSQPHEINSDQSTWQLEKLGDLLGIQKAEETPSKRDASGLPDDAYTSDSSDTSSSGNISAQVRR